MIESSNVAIEVVNLRVQTKVASSGYNSNSSNALSKWGIERHGVVRIKEAKKKQ